MKISKMAKPPKGELEKETFNVLKGLPASKTASRAFDIFSKEFKKEVLEAFLLVDISSEEIEETLGVPEDVVDFYRKIFFDVGVFEDLLDKIDYSRTYDKSIFGSELKKFAVDMGKESLKIRFSHGEQSVDPVKVQEGIRATAFMVGQMVKVNPVDSKMARAALKWAQLALRATEESSENRTGVVEKIMLELESEDDTTNADEMGIPTEKIEH